MSELLRKAGEIKIQLDASNASEAQRQAVQREQERLRAIQYEADKLQSQEHIAEFLELVRLHGAPTTDVFFMPHPGTRGNGLHRGYDKTTHYPGWVISEPLDEYPYHDGDFLLANGVTYGWNQTTTLNGQVLHESGGQEHIYETTYAGDEGLELLGNLLARLGIG